MKFIYKINKPLRPFIIDDVPSMSGVQDIKVKDKNIEVKVSDKFIEDFFGKPITKITVDDIVDYAEGGLPDILLDAFSDNNINLSVNDITFSDIDL